MVGRSSLGTSRRDLVSPATAPFLLKNFCQKSDSWASSATAAPAASMAARNSLILSSIVHLRLTRGGAKQKGLVPVRIRDEALVSQNSAVPPVFRMRTCGTLYLPVTVQGPLHATGPQKRRFPRTTQERTSARAAAGSFQPVTALSGPTDPRVLSPSKRFCILHQYSHAAGICQARNIQRKRGADPVARAPFEVLYCGGLSRCGGQAYAGYTGKC